MSLRSKSSAKPSAIEPERFHNAGPLLLAGRRRHYTGNTRGQIPSLWHEVGPQLDKVRSRVGEAAYGVCLSTAENHEEFDYLAGTEVSDVQHLPPNWTYLRLPARHYAVFRHDGSVTDLAATVKEIMQGWLPESGKELAVVGSDSPDFLEYYGPGYDPATGRGDIQVWLPVKS